ncbi:MAG: hypothetical protein J6W96_00215, partial [Alphaproteobacteria bacterium]|nr:hypothetical protein [Alphaproteobacteria bacterium]
MKKTIISKAIIRGVITFDSLCHSWLARNGAGINPEILDAVLSANPKWLEQTISPANTYPRFEFISSDLYFKNINISDITLLGLSIAWNDTEAEAVIKKHLALHTITENPVAKIFGQNKLYINVNIRNLREILALLDEKKSYFKIREMFSKKFIELGVYLDGYYVTKLNLPERHWFTSEVTTRIMKIWEKPWFLREAIYPKEIPQCSLIK